MSTILYAIGMLAGGLAVGYNAGRVREYHRMRAILDDLISSRIPVRPLAVSSDPTLFDQDA